jgi:hypothetical protein
MFLLYLTAAIIGWGGSFPRKATAAKVVRQAEASKQNPETNAHPYLEEPPRKLVKLVPELKGIQPATDQHELPMILQNISETVDEFFDNIVDLIADEEIIQERLGGNEAVLMTEKVRGSYLILRHGNGMAANFEEYRTDAEGNRMDQVGRDRGFIVTTGFALSCVYFSSASRADATFRYLGDQKLNGRDTYVVAFAQRPDKASIKVTMIGPQGIPVHMLMQGMVWVDKANFRILRIRTDLLTRKPEVELDEQTTKVSFSEVRFADVTAALWLPRDVDVSVKFGQSRDRHFDETFQNAHRYTNYRRYRVSTEIVAPQ